MKKALALVLAMLMLCTCAVAEEETVNSYYFDASVLGGVEGNFAAVADLGLQVFIPSHFVAYEPSEADTARGVIAAMGAEDGSIAMSISYAGVADAAGNLITDLPSLRDFYASQGVTEMEIAYFNDLPALYYVLTAPTVYGNLALINAEGYVVAFSVITNGEEANLALGTAILSSVMACEVAE